MARNLPLALIIFLTCSSLRALEPELLWRYAIDSAGSKIWIRNLGKKPAPFLSISPDDIIHICFTDGTLAALNKKGREIWRTDIGGIPYVKPAYKSDGTMFISAGSTLYGLSHRGNVKWMVTFLYPVRQLETGADETIYVLLGDGTFQVYSPLGRMLWKKGPETGIVSYVSGGAGSLFCLTASGDCLEFDRAGSLIDQKKLAAGKGAVQFLKRKNGFAVISSAKLMAFNGAMELEWDHAFAGGGLGYGVFDDKDRFYGLNADGSLFTTAKEEKEFQIYSMEPGTPAPVLSQNGRLYVGGKDWIVYAFSANPAVAGEEPRNPGTGMDEGPPLPETGGSSALSSYFAVLAGSSNIEDNFRALDELKRLTNSRNYMEQEPVMVPVLEKLSTAGLMNPPGNTPAGKALSYVIRERTAEILGIISTPEAEKVLLPMLYYEWDREALILVIKALGAMRRDKDGAVADYLNALLSRGGTLGRDNFVVWAMIDACDSLSAYQAYLPRGMAEVLFSIYRGDFLQFVREGAMKVLRVNAS